MTDNRHIANTNRHTVDDAYDRIAQIVQAVDEAIAPHDVLDPIDLSGPRPHLGVRRLHRCDHLRQRHAKGAHCIRINIHLVLQNMPTDRRHLSDAIGGG